MPDLLAQILFLLACAAILVRAEPANASMSEQTPLLIRVSFNLLAAGALGGIFYTLGGAVPHWIGVLLALGIAVLLLCDRRVRALTGIRPLNPKDKGPRHA